MIFQSVGKNAVALASFALITALLLSSVNNLTADRIAHSERIAAQKALLEILQFSAESKSASARSRCLGQIYVHT
jgi:Na+-translocating ferredoxin:NAD+ oxidoreductase RnfG subunit